VKARESMKSTSGAIRAMRVEITGWLKDGERYSKDWPEEKRKAHREHEASRRKEWIALTESSQKLLNCLWRHWVTYHTQHGTAVKIVEYLDALKAWREARVKAEEAVGEKKFKPANWEKDNPKPRLSAVALPKGEGYAKWSFTHESDRMKEGPSLQNDLYHIINKTFVEFNVRTITLILNKWASLLTSRKAASGNLSGWMSILLGNESIPSFNSPQPIPFDKVSCPNGMPLRKDDRGTYFFDLSIERRESDGKNRTIKDACVLHMPKKKYSRVYTVLDNVISGEWEFKGSQVIYDKGKRKWFALVSYEIPTENIRSVNMDRVLFVRPGRHYDWRVSVCGRKSWGIGGSARRRSGPGGPVMSLRTRILRERRERQEHTRFIGSNQKSHGGGRVRSVWTKLSSRWRDAVKRYNHEVTKQIVKLAMDKQCGRIVYFQPKGDQRSNRWLSVQGNDGRSNMSWDYFQFGSLLQSKCQLVGIDISVETMNREWGDGEGEGKRADVYLVQTQPSQPVG